MSISIPDFSRLNVLVVGDLMLDRYWHGGTSRISPEAPVPVCRVERVEERPGGAANVAANLVALGAGCTVFGVVGDDPEGHRLEALLQERGIRSELQVSRDMATITKLRVISRNQQLMRLDFEDGIASDVLAELEARYREAVGTADVVILSDYAKGTLSEAGTLIDIAREAGVPVLVDPKGTDFGRYRRASVITPNIGEFEGVAGPCGDDETLVARGEALRDELGLEALLVTRSERGMTVLPSGREAVHLPTRAREVFDVTGAGDTVIALMAAGLAAGLAHVQAAEIANIGAGLVVGKLGAASVTASELRHAVRLQRPGALHEVMDEEALLDAVAHARERGETIVMTNGCFDLLHAGHVAYLRDSAALGDRLIVAVNDDESVRRLKGDQRPLTTLRHRMEVLAALESVDWVVAFAEDTPRRLVERLLPDVLVKGGDYKPEEIAGARAVMDNGGVVRVLEFVEGLSTTDIVDRIRRNA